MKLQNNKKKKTIVIVSVIVAVLVVAAVAGIILSLFKGPDQVDPKEIQSISLSTPPTKTTYYVGEPFDATGVSVQVKTNDMSYTSFVDYTNLTFSGFDSSAPAEEQVITVSYKGFTTTFTVTIKEIPSATPTLVSIKLSDNFVSTYTLDWWKEYGPVFDNVDLICTYSDGTEKRVPMSAGYCLEIDTSIDTPTTVDIPVQYIDGGIVAEMTITVTITN